MKLDSPRTPTMVAIWRVLMSGEVKRAMEDAEPVLMTFFAMPGYHARTDARDKALTDWVARDQARLKAVVGAWRHPAFIPFTSKPEVYAYMEGCAKSDKAAVVLTLGLPGAMSLLFRAPMSCVVCLGLAGVSSTFAQAQFGSIFDGMSCCFACYPECVHSLAVHPFTGKQLSSCHISVKSAIHHLEVNIASSGKLYVDREYTASELLDMLTRSMLSATTTDGIEVVYGPREDL